MSSNLRLTRNVLAVICHDNPEAIRAFELLFAGAGLAGWDFDITIVTSDTTLDDTMYTVFSDSTLGDITLTLPSAVGNLGREYIIKDIGTGGNSTTVDGAGSETIDLAPNKVLLSMDAITPQSDDANWWIV